MSTTRIVGVGVGLILSFFALLYLLFSVAIYTHEPGVAHPKANSTLASLPFLITFCIVFLCFYSAEVSIGRALLRSIVAEVCVLLLIFGSYLILIASY